ncbi:MAG: hypothetical protein WDW36_009943 [Sanguina aurantia]
MDNVALPAAAAAVESVAAVREDQVQSAVGFLSHPKVKDSPLATKRSFLERKGLTAAEIEEAFRRVPEGGPQPSPLAAPTQPAYGQPSASGAASQAQQHANALVPVGSAGPVQQQQFQQQQRALVQPVRWTQVVLGLGVAAVSAYAFAALALPKIKEVYANWCAVQLQREKDMEASRLGLLAAVDSMQQVSRDLQSVSRSIVEASQLMKDQTAAMAAQQAATAAQQVQIAAAQDNRNRGDVQPFLDNATHAANDSASVRRELTDIHTALQRVTGGSRWNTVAAATAPHAGDPPHGSHRYTSAAAAAAPTQPDGAHGTPNGGGSSSGNEEVPFYGQHHYSETGLHTSNGSRNGARTGNMTPSPPPVPYSPGRYGSAADPYAAQPGSGIATNPYAVQAGAPVSPYAGYTSPAPTSMASMQYGGRSAFGAGSQGRDSSEERGGASEDRSRGTHGERGYPQPPAHSDQPQYGYPTGQVTQQQVTQQQVTQQGDFHLAHPGLGSGLTEWGSMPLLDGSRSPGAQAAEAGSVGAASEAGSGSASPSIAEVMAMVAAGVTPPNVRVINDSPPDPSQPITESRLSPIPKPWARNGWNVPPSPSTNQAATPSAGAADSAALYDNGTTAGGAHSVPHSPSLPAGSGVGGGAVRSIAGLGSTSLSRFAADRLADSPSAAADNTSPTSPFLPQQQQQQGGSASPDTAQPAYPASGSREQPPPPSLAQDGGAASGSVAVSAATVAAAAAAAATAAAAAAAAEVAASQHHRVSILPAPGTGPIWRPPPPHVTAPPPATSAAAADQRGISEQASRGGVGARAPLASYALDTPGDSTPVRASPEAGRPGSPNRASPAAPGGFALNSNAKPFFVPTNAAVAAVPRQEGEGSAPAAAAAAAAAAADGYGFLADAEGASPEAKSFAARLFAAGPFTDLQQLLTSARGCWWHEMTVVDWLEAFDAHPKIGESAHSKPAAFAAYSSSEQAAAETSSCGDVQADLRQLNANYLARFGHIFIICASGRSAPEILQVLRQRCKSMPHEELATAATEQMAITELRLCKLWAEACAVHGRTTGVAVNTEGHAGAREHCSTLAGGPTPLQAQRTQRRAEQLLSHLSAAAAHGRDKDAQGGSSAGPTAPAASAGARSPITTHVLDTATGLPAEGLPLALLKQDAVSLLYRRVSGGVTNEDGRVGGLLPPSDHLAPGRYRMRFDVAAYHRVCKLRHATFYADLPFYNEVVVEFNITADKAGEHYHIPLLLSPFGFSTYRGS